MSDLISWITPDYLFLLLREKDFGLNITNIVCDQSGSGNEKSDEIRANMNRIRLRPSIPMSSNSLESENGKPALENINPFFMRFKDNAWNAWQRIPVQYLHVVWNTLGQHLYYAWQNFILQIQLKYSPLQFL